MKPGNCELLITYGKTCRSLYLLNSINYEILSELDDLKIIENKEFFAAIETLRFILKRNYFEMIRNLR